MKRILISVVLSILLVSCTPSMSEETLKEIVTPLIEASYDLNEIYFGKGLPADEEQKAAALEYDKKSDTDIKIGSYVDVSEDSPYQTADELRKATEAVYSEDYCEYLFSMSFSGISADENTVIYARYIEQEDGALTVRTTVESEAEKLNRTYDMDTIDIVKQRDDYVVFKLLSYVDGKEDAAVEIKMVNEDGGWRLDTPTY